MAKQQAMSKTKNESVHLIHFGWLQLSCWDEADGVIWLLTRRMQIWAVQQFDSQHHAEANLGALCTD